MTYISFLYYSLGNVKLAAFWLIRSTCIILEAKEMFMLTNLSIIKIRGIEAIKMIEVMSKDKKS